MISKKRTIKQNNVIQLLLCLVIIILLNIIGSYVFTRFDLTSEKRYSLSPATKKALRNLDDVVYFKVYLQGDFPAGFKRLRNETMEMLDEFRAYSDNIQYEFINPSSGSDKKERNSVYQLLIQRGLNPTDLQVKTKDGSNRQIIFPGALVTYKTREIPLQLLNNQIGESPEAVLNNSIKNLEYNLISTIRKLSVVDKPKIAFIEGQGELNSGQVYDIMTALSEYYAVDRVKINQKIYSLTRRDSLKGGKIAIVNKYKAIVIAKPDSAFDEKDKFIIDQFIMRGGKVLWLIDPVFASMDSLQKNNESMGVTNDLKLDDQLFNYGVRLNYNLVLDLNSVPIPIVTGRMGNQPQIEFFPWYYFPVVMSSGVHPIVNNLNAVKFEFASSLDTVEAPGIKKTILLKTSKYSRIVNAPASINLEICRNKPDERMFNNPNQPVAVLLEGEFQSLFTNRVPPEIMNNKLIGFKGKSIPTAMVVVSDGDVIKNQFNRSQGYPLPLGYDQDTRQTFGNKDFVLNILNYLCDDSGLLYTRTREVQLRLLDKTKVEKQKIYWQLTNIFLPIILVIGFGIVQGIIRKRKFTRI
ncbi:MAG TPA: gliding motility-associated ABC transporter substrate-binding protein GldG [Bacteroidales bacterium]|nr:gliding motility-associated ABC transporter substrate-binding protein GldG [Bacteroidales bacterium]